MKSASCNSGDICGAAPLCGLDKEGRCCAESRRLANSESGEAAALTSASISGVFIGVDGTPIAGVCDLLMGWFTGSSLRGARPSTSSLPTPCTTTLTGLYPLTSAALDVELPLAELPAARGATMAAASAGDGPCLPELSAGLFTPKPAGIGVLTSSGPPGARSNGVVASMSATRSPGAGDGDSRPSMQGDKEDRPSDEGPAIESKPAAPVEVEAPCGECTLALSLTGSPVAATLAAAARLAVHALRFRPGPPNLRLSRQFPQAPQSSPGLAPATGVAVEAAGAPGNA
mmetsp:Transcript_17667/g.57842  ORF Transcript_17667/g.57842 Transcript_17667/m.57842 type:complete len:287 (-) Transcript_17667:192-1052(-)|eukprot:scaffold18299_cov117-Isochrysis_galbana.AAC.8